MTIFERGISPKVFFTSFSIFMVLLIVLAGLSYGLIFIPIMYLIVTVPIMMVLFYLRGINGGMTKKQLFLPLVLFVLVCALIYLFLLIMDIPFPLFIFMFVMINPIAWVLGGLAAAGTLIYFFKVSLSKKVILSDQSITPIVGVTGNSSSVSQSTQPSGQTILIGQGTNSGRNSVLIIIFGLIAIVSIFIDFVPMLESCILFILFFIAIGVYAHKRGHSLKATILLPYIFLFLYPFTVLMIDEIMSFRHQDELTGRWTIQEDWKISDIVKITLAPINPAFQEEYSMQLENYYIEYTTAQIFLGTLLILFFLHMWICLRKIKHKIYV